LTATGVRRLACSCAGVQGEDRALEPLAGFDGDRPDRRVVDDPEDRHWIHGLDDGLAAVVTKDDIAWQQRAD
jgi:hypothetical protein